MSEPDKLIPPPPLVRERLARNIRERRLLRALLRLSVRAADETRQIEIPKSNQETYGKGVSS